MRFACALAVVAFSALHAEDAQAAVERGLAAERDGRYQDAAQAFQKAAELNPTDVNTRQHLAGAWLNLYFEAPDAPANLAYAEKAEAEFNRVLGMAPKNQIALTSIALVRYRQAEQSEDAQEKSRKLDEVRTWYLTQLGNDAPAHRGYALESAAYLQWHQQFTAARQHFGMQPEDPGPLPNSGTRQDLKKRYGPMIDDGIARLQAAIEKEPKDGSAANQMGLFLRDRADLRDTPDQYREDLAKADEWKQKALTAMRQHKPPERIRVSGNVQAASLITKVTPRYPQEAKQQRIQGMVLFNVIIGKDGHIKNIDLASGPPALVAAAQDAVRQWVYKPMMLNGDPVEVVTQIYVNFSLAP
jgi:TonB family protein